MSDLETSFHDAILTRRDFLCRSGMALGSLGLTGLLASQGPLEASPSPVPRRV